MNQLFVVDKGSSQAEFGDAEILSNLEIQVTVY